MGKIFMGKIYKLSNRPSDLIYQEVHKSEKENIRSYFGEQIVYNQRLKRSGNVVKSNRYEEFQRRGFERKNLVEKKRAKVTDPKQKEMNSLRSGRRAKDKLVDIINSNFGLRSRENVPGRKSVKFLTLTYKKCMDNLSRAHDDFVKLIDQIGHYLDEKVEYIAVPELQKRGAWHLHVVLYSSFIPIRWLIEKWNKENGHGSVDLHEIKHINNLGKYLAKYVSKTFVDENLEGKHRYWCSEGFKDKTVNLYANVEPGKGMTHQELIDYFDGYIVSMRQGFYTGEYTGKVDYLDLTLKPCPEVEKLCRVLETGFHWVAS
jgi:hypothetical protein